MRSEVWIGCGDLLAAVVVGVAGWGKGGAFGGAGAFEFDGAVVGLGVVVLGVGGCVLGVVAAVVGVFGNEVGGAVDAAGGDGVWGVGGVGV